MSALYCVLVGLYVAGVIEVFVGVKGICKLFAFVWPIFISRSVVDLMKRDAGQK